MYQLPLILDCWDKINKYQVGNEGKAACSKKSISKHSIECKCKREWCLNYFVSHFPLSAFQDFNFTDIPIKFMWQLISKQKSSYNSRIVIIVKGVGKLCWSLEKETLQSGVLRKVANTKVIALTQYSLNPIMYEQDATIVKRINLETGLVDTDRSSYSFSRHAVSKAFGTFFPFFFCLFLWGFFKPNDS